MTQAATEVNLGFAQMRIPAGTHICQIYSEKKERDEALLKFLLQGLRARERSACFSTDVPEDAFRDHFSRNGFSLDDALRTGNLTIEDAANIYFRDGRFDPDRLLEALADFHEGCENNGYAGARVIGEMLPEIVRTPGGERLLEYESRVSMLLRERPITTVCQYDASAFDGAMIMDILKVHPMMVVRGTVVHNPFYVTPEDFFDAR